MLQKTIADPTHGSLEAAILDQKVAGTFGDQPYAYVPVYAQGTKWGLGIAIENEQGYSPIGGMEFNSSDEAKKFADGMNMHIGLDPLTATKIVCSTMRGKVRAEW